jgi:hypothetical protein
MNTPIPEETLARIKEALSCGQKIEAIRLYRDSTGADLATAKTAMEHLDFEHPPRHRKGSPRLADVWTPLRFKRAVSVGHVWSEVRFLCSSDSVWAYLP